MLIDFGPEVTVLDGDNEDFAHLYLVGGDWVLATAHTAPEGAIWVGGVVDDGGDAVSFGEAKSLL